MPRAQRKCSRPRARTRLLRTRGNGDVAMKQDIPGTIMFDGDRRRRVLRSTACASHSTAPRTARPSCATRTPIAGSSASARSSAPRFRSRNVLAMIEAGGNVYYLAKLAGIFGLNVQDIGAQQTGTSVEELQSEARRRREVDHGPDHRRHRDHPRSRRSARRSPRRKQNDPYWKPFFEGFDYVHYWLAREKPGRRRDLLQRPRPQLLSRQAADLRGRRGEANTATRTKAGAFRFAARSPATRICRGI